MKSPFFVGSVASAVLSVSTVWSACAETVGTAADLANNKKTVAYVYSRTVQNLLFRLAVEQDRKFGLQQDCKSQYRVEPYSIAVLQPIVFPDNKQHPEKGVWNFRYQLQRCGKSKFYNAMFMASADGETPPTPRAYYPGTTNAGPVLIRDAIQPALMSAVLKSGLKDCKDTDVFDMRVSREAHDLARDGKNLKGVWEEIWTFRLCGQMVETEITFIPDQTGGGTSFSIAPVQSGEAAGKR